MVTKFSLATVWLLSCTTIFGVPLEPINSHPASSAFPPVEDILGRLERDFELVDSGYAASHRGIDVAVSAGEVIRSPVAGWIHFSGFVVDRPVVTVIDHAGELYAFEPACSGFLRGERVGAREAIAKVCSGNEQYRHCHETCLHISLRVQGQYLSPMVRFGLLKPSRLYPIDHAQQ